MTNTVCPNCGFKNKSVATNCLRCYASLAGVAAEVFAERRHSAGNLKNKIVRGAGLAVALFVSIVGVAALYRVKVASDQRAAFASAISSASMFKEPVTVQAGWYSYNNPETNRFDQEATPAAYVLDRLGLLHVRNEVFSDPGEEQISEATGQGAVSYNHITLQLTEAGQSQAATWKAYPNTDPKKNGWRVPIGEREFMKIKWVQALPEGEALKDEALVAFTWRWKPNETGRAFDKSSSSFVTFKEVKFYPRDVFEIEVNDSRTDYWGVAETVRKNGLWSVRAIHWSGPQGVQFSPNAAKQIEEIVRRSNQ